MPKTSLQNLRESIESARELTPEHRDELRRVVEDLENEIHPIVESDAPVTDAGELRDAIDLSGKLVKKKGSEAEVDEEEDGDLLNEFETAVDKIAINHPVVAGFLTALGKLV